MPKIHFEGNPPRMDFTLVKNHSGVTLIDIPSKQVHSLGDGELASLVSDAGNSLRRTIEATLKGMEPTQRIKVQIFVHPGDNYGFSDYGYPAGFPGLGDQIQFALGGPDKTSKATIKPVVGNKFGQNEVKEVKKIVIIGEGNIVPGSPIIPGAEIRHPQTDNEQSGADMIELD